MDASRPPVPAPLHGPFPVPPSKSEHQRALVLRQLAGGETLLETAATGRPGQDVQSLAAALEALGPWTGDALGHSRENLRLDMGEGATGFRYAVALAALRPPGSRTLVTGRPRLRAREHRPLLRALRALGAHVVRRSSGAVRVLAGDGSGSPLGGGRVRIEAGVSSQFASSLLLVAPVLGGLELSFPGPAASRPYLRMTLRMLAAFGIEVEAHGLDGPAGRIRVGAGRPRAARVELAPDASAAAAWWAAVGLRGGEVVTPGLDTSSLQADVALLGLLERMGADVEELPGVGVRVRSGGQTLRAPGAVDLSDSPDLIFLVGCLAAVAQGETRITGLTATRGKESDRVAVLVSGLEAVGADVRLDPGDELRIRGRRLHGGDVRVAGDHRAVFGFGVLGLQTPGIRLLGAVSCVSKSHPDFLADLARLTREGSGSP